MSADEFGIEFTLLSETHQDPGLLQAAYERIMRPSFVADELPGPESLTPGGGASLLIAKDRETKNPLGIARLLTGGGDGVGLLEYLAADPQVRGRGLGGALLDQCRVIWTEAGELVVLAEVHDPRVHAESADERPAARLRFYERNGARLLSVPWTQPALSPETDRVEGMLLLVMYADPSRVGSSLDRECVLRWAQGYFAHEAPRADGRERGGSHVLAALSGDEPLAIGPIAQLDDLVPLTAVRELGPHEHEPSLEA